MKSKKNIKELLNQEYIISEFYLLFNKHKSFDDWPQRVLDASCIDAGMRCITEMVLIPLFKIREKKLTESYFFKQNVDKWFGVAIQ